ncbi:MAG TPA: porin [Pararhizobium sp.]|nr:porin [Pararhizobium sp.]HTO32107.1 porin [Pararhizobium sp.]
MARSHNPQAVCDAFGEGYFYIPGIETCLKSGIGQGWEA